MVSDSAFICVLEALIFLWFMVLMSVIVHRTAGLQASCRQFCCRMGTDIQATSTNQGALSLFMNPPLNLTALQRDKHL